MWNFCGILSIQKKLPLSKLVLTQTTQRDPYFVYKFQICFESAALFQSFILFNPKPLSLFGTQSKSHTTLALAQHASLSLHKNLLNFCSINLIIFLDNTKILDQYTWMLYKTEVRELQTTNKGFSF